MLERAFSGALLVAAGLAAVGCSGRRLVQGAGAPGTTTILVENRIASADELDRFLVTVDDATVPLSTLPPRGEAAVLTALRLAPGPHTLAVRVVTHSQGDDRAVVAAAQTFHVAAAAASIAIAVRSRAAGSLDGPVAIDLAMRGGHLTAPLDAVPPEGREERCAPLQPTPQALCRAAGDLDDAARRNDPASVLCVRDKLATMRQLAALGTMAEPQVLALAREIDRCGRSDVVGGPDGTTVIKPALSSLR